MRAVTILKRSQVEWARASGLVPDGRGYLQTVEPNLRARLSYFTEAEFRRASGGELIDRPRWPAKMRALHSSSAFAVNFFDFWRTRDKTPLASALGIYGSIQSLSFEAQFPTGLEGAPPNLDLLLEVEPGPSVAIESKFTELYSHKPAKVPFKAKYFPPGRRLWEEVGIPACQRLAESISKEPKRFLVLNAAQLLKHALGLASAVHQDSLADIRPKNCSLLYLFFDHPCSESEQHRRELAEFESELRGEVGFRSSSYQSVFAALCTQKDAEASAYRNYLAERYFGGCHSTSDCT